MKALTVVVTSILLAGRVTALAEDADPPAKTPPTSAPATAPAKTIFGEPADPSRRTSDDVAMPVVAPQKVRFHLPIIDDALGAAPEEVTGAFETLTARKSHRRIAALFQHRDLDGGGHRGAWLLSPPGDALWVFGPFRAAAVTLRLNQGRVVRLALHYPSLPQADFRVLLNKLQPFIGGKEIDLTSITQPRRKGVRVTLTGNKTQKLPIPVHCSIYWWEGHNAAEARDTCLIFEIDPVEWYLLYHPVDEDLAASMRSGKPTPGMTREQVVLSVGRLPWRETPLPGGKGTVINWHEYSDHWKEDRVVARARFDSDGKLSEFKTWSANAKDAPKP